MKKRTTPILGRALPKTAMAWLLALVMVVGLLPGAVITDALAATETIGLTYAEGKGKSFSNSGDQLAMEQELSEVPLSFEATIMLPAGYTNRAGVIAGNWRNGPNSGEFDSTREYVNFEIAANGAPRLYWQESHGTSTAASHKLDLTFDEVNVATGEYVHVAVTYDPDTDTASCYVNGELKQTLTNGNITPTVPFGPLIVGGDYRNEASTVEKDCKGSAVPHNAQYFKGTIANLSVWSSVLAGTDVKAHYDALCADGSAVPSTGSALLGSWDLTAPDANGDYADKSANGNDVYVFADWVDSTFAEGDYTMLVMPDPQILMKWQTESWYKYSQWIADNADDLNVQAIISVGDMVNDNTTTQWTQSVQGVEMFETTGIPWIPMRGNHDPSAEFNQYFPYSKYSQKSWFGGSYEEGKMDFVYWFVNVGDREYMMLYLGWAPTWDVLDWAAGVIEAFPEKNVIISTHAYMNWDNTLLTTGDGGCVGNYSGLSGYPEGTDIWEKLGKYENVVLALGGHIGSTDLAVWTDENGAGNTVTSMLVDSQHLDYVAAGLIAVLTFHEDSDTVDVNWYSPVKDKFFRERNQFSITVPHVEASAETSSADKSALKATVLGCASIEQAGYTPESWAPYASALTAANAVLADDKATQDQVNAAVTALKNAKAALVERTGLYFSASAKNYAQFTACTVIPETVEVWVKIPEGYSTREMIVGGHGKSGKSNSEIFWSIEMNFDGTLRWWEEGFDPDVTKNAQREMAYVKFDGKDNEDIIKLNTGEWMLITIVRDQEKNEIRAYINGELRGTSSKTYAKLATSETVFQYTDGKNTTDPPRLGRDWRSSPLTFEGQIGELRMWTDDRTADEIKTDFEGAIDLNDANLYGCWQLTEIPVTTTHPYIFNNLATGTAAATGLGIETCGFTSARDTTALEAAITEAEALDESEYTADSWTALETALTAAEAAVADTTNKQTDVVAALNALQGAMDALEVERDGLTFSAAAKNYAQFSQNMVIPESVEVWFRMPDGHTARNTIVGGYGYPSAASTTEIFWAIDYYSDGKLYWWEEAAGKELWAEIKGVTVNTGEWYLLSVVRDQENKEIRCYLNGELVHTITNLAAKNGSVTNVMDYTTGKTTTDPTRLGRDWRETQSGSNKGKPLVFEGQIGEIRVYNDGRTADEIKAGYENDTLPASKRSDDYLSDANLTGCWRLRDLTGIEYHPYTFNNLSTGTGAVSALTISTAGFTSTAVDSDKTALKTAIDAAKALVETDYTAESWQALASALPAAEEIRVNPVVGQTLVNEAEAALEAAMAALELKEREGLTFSAAEKNYAQFSDRMTIPETIEVWVKIPKDYTSRNMIVGGYGVDGQSYTEVYWSIEMNAGGTLRYWEEAYGHKEMSQVKFDGDKDDEVIKINTGEWVLITIVRDQEKDEIRAYIDGVLAGTSTKVTASGTNVIDTNQGELTSTPLRLGRDWRETQTSGSYKDKPLSYEGQIGELRVWNRDLDNTEIKANYDNDKLAVSQRSAAYLADDGLYGCWKLRDLTDEELHTFTFANQTTGTNAATGLSIQTLGFTTVLDTSALEAAILEAQGLNDDDYTDESWAAVAEALEAALDTLNSETAGQALIDDAAKALEDAMAALKDASVFVSGLTFSAADLDYAQFTDRMTMPETIEVWVKIPKGYTSRNMIVGGYGSSAYGSSEELYWSIEMNDGGTLRYWEEGIGQLELASIKFNDSDSKPKILINTGEWILITIVRDQENAQVRAYINGELAGTSSKVTASGKNVLKENQGKLTSTALRLGRDWRDTNGKAALKYEGKIGELRVWNRDLTADEIKANYENDIKKDSEESRDYLSDANLYGAWKLRDLTANEGHPHIFTNQATGAAAAKDLSIRTVGFLEAEDDVVPDYSAEYADATGIKFDNGINQMRAEEQFDAPIRTISALVNLPSGSAGGVILGNDQYIGGYSSDKAWINLEVNSSGQPFLQLRYKNQSKPNVYTADTVDLRGKGWVLVTVVFDEDCDLVRWYINGKRVESELGATAGIYAPYQPMKIGGDYSFSLNSTTNTSKYNTTYFKGSIAYVSAWSSVRTGTEILAEAQALQANYTAVPTSGDGLLASWSFAGTGDVLTTAYADKSPNGNDAEPFAELINDYDSQYIKDNNIATELPEAEEGTYSLVLMPDIQNITRDYMGGYSAYLDDYMQWILANREKYNILAYLSMGDLVQDDNCTGIASEWTNADNAFKLTEAAGLPGIPMRGNHDCSAYYNQYIQYADYASQPWFGGAYDDGYLDSTYWFIEAGERTYLVFSLGWSSASSAMAYNNGKGDPDDAGEIKLGDDAGLIKWVNETIEKYPNANVIFTAHDGMSYTGEYSSNGQKLYNKILSQHDNIVLASYGHVHAPTVVDRTDTRSDGVSFSSLLVDGQGIDQYEGCKGFICLLTFKEGSDEVAVNWYSVRDGSLYRVDSQYSITVPHVKGVDLTGIKSGIEAAGELTEADYTTTSWTALETALAAAETVVANKLSVSQTEVDAAEEALEDAVAALVERGDKTELQAAVNEAKKLNKADYTSDTWTALEEALTAAQAVLDNIDAIQSEVDAAETALEAAIAALKKPAIEPTVVGTYTYTGKVQTVVLSGLESYMTVTDGNTGTDAKSYQVTIALADGYEWINSSDGNIEWTISKAQAEITVNATPIVVTYGDTVTLPSATTNFGTVTCDKTADDLVNAGTYTVTYTVAGNTNWDGTTKTVSVTINPKPVAEPTVVGTYTYDGSEQTVELKGVEAFMTVDSGTKGTAAGSYEVSITLDRNYTWADGSDGRVQWSIGKAQAHITVIDKLIMISFPAPNLSNPVAGKDYTVTGLVNGDGVDTVTLTCNPDMHRAGAYAILVSAEDPNYTFTYTYGKLVVAAGSYDPLAGGSAPGGGTVICNCYKFSDVNVNAWYHPAVCYAVNNGIMNGTGNGSTFSPYLNLSRAMMMTMLARLDGVNTDGGATWYAKGMAWAVENGISDGTNPNADITREQMVTMLYRYADSPVVIGDYLTGNPDADEVSSWAKDAMNWAVATGVIQGNEKGELNPQGTATRAEVAQIFMNYTDK